MLECLFMGKVIFNSFAVNPRTPIARALVVVDMFTGNTSNVNLFDLNEQPLSFPSCETNEHGLFAVPFAMDARNLADVLGPIDFSFSVKEWDNELKRSNRSRFRLQRFRGRLIPVLNWRRVADGLIPDLRNPEDAAGFGIDLYQIARGMRFPGLPVTRPSPDFYGSICSKLITIAQ